MTDPEDHQDDEGVGESAAEAIEDLVAEFIEATESGNSLDIDEFAGRHPDLEPELRRALRCVDRAYAMFPGGDADRVPESIGAYRVLGEIGRGGMGRVLRVESRASPGEVLALKLLSTPSWLNPRAVERLRREGRVLARLAHANILRIFEIGEVDGTPFLAMEMIDGPSLAELIADAKAHRAAASPATPVDLLDFPGEGRGGVIGAARVIAESARAVSAAHAEGLQHRDLKPANIMLRRDGVPVLIDFGLVGGDTGPTLTRTGDVLGTPQYMAPEQAIGGAVGPAADIYSLGAVLYELVTLLPPHAGSDSASVLQAVRTQPIRPIRRVDVRLPRGLETVVLRATAFRPERRYASAVALADDLDAFVAGEAVRARRPGLIERSADAWRFHGRALAVAAAVVLALVAIIVIARPSERETAARRAAAFERFATAWAAADRGKMLTAVDDLAARAARPAMVACLRSIAAGGAIEAPTDETDIGLLAGGLRQYASKRFDAAIGTLERAASESPGMALPVVVRGFAARRAGKLDIAQAELTAALHLLPGSVAVRSELVKVYRSKKRFAEAERVLLDAISLRLGDAEMWLDLARVRYEIARRLPESKRDYRSGLAAAQNAIALAGDKVSDDMLRTEAQGLDMNKRFAESEPIYRALLRRHPNRATDRFMFAVCLDSNHKLIEAKQEYETLCKQLPNHPRPKMSMAWLCSGSDLSCPQCERYFAEHEGLLDYARAEKLVRESMRIDRGVDPQSVSLAVDIARRINRREGLATLLAELIVEATDAGDDKRIAHLTRERRRLLR